MAFITGSLTDANPGPALYALMAPALTTAGFTLVDTVVISTRTHKVWKSAAANNSQNLDWYLDVAYTTAGAGSLWLTPFEFYDPATDLGYRGAYGGAVSTTIEATYYSRYGATGYALETNWLGGVGTVISLSLTTSAFGYWMSLTGNRCVLLTSSEPTKMLYTGMYAPDPLYAAKAGAALYPLLQAKIIATSATGALAASGTAASTVSAAQTRMPPYTALTGSGWGQCLSLYTAGAAANAVIGPTIPIVSPGYPPIIWPINVVADAYAVQPALFGTLIDTATISASGTVARGDTITVDGATWVLGSVAAGSSLLMKQV